MEEDTDGNNGSSQSAPGEEEIYKKSDWFDEECRQALTARNKAKLERDRNRKQETIKNFEEKRRIAKQVCRYKKREKLHKQLKLIEDHYVNKEIKNFYQEAKQTKPAKNTRSMYCKSKEGLLLGDPAEKLNRWKQYFEELLNKNGDPEQEIDTTVMPDRPEGIEPGVEEPTEQEIVKEIKNLKNNKSAGGNGIPAEILKAGGERLHKRVCQLILEIWQEEKMPEEWGNAVICPIYKKGDKTLCENYRGIALLDIVYKTLAKVIRNRLQKYVNKIVGEYQGGFRSGRATTDQIFTLKMIQNGSYEHNLSLHMLFIDFKQAYDSIAREKLYEILETLGIPKKLANLIKMTLNKTNNRILLEGTYSGEFTNTRGLRQGDPLSTDLFNLTLEAIMRGGKMQKTGLLLHHKHQCIAYADDVVLLARSRKELQNAFKNFEKESRRYGLLVNENKTKYMEMKANITEANKYIKFLTEREQYNIENVNQFEYLGSIMTSTGQESEEIERRIIKGSRATGALTSMLKARNISRAAKVRIYETAIRPVVMYACETWTMTKGDETKLEIWERKVLRKIFGGIKISEGISRRRTNQEVMQMYGRPKITQKIRAQRVRWIGHVIRMPEQRWAKRVLFEGEGGKKRRGRPRKKWYDTVREDINDLGVGNWREKARDREKWRQIVKDIEVKGLQGL